MTFVNRLASHQPIDDALDIPYIDDMADLMIISIIGHEMKEPYCAGTYVIIDASVCEPYMDGVYISMTGDAIRYTMILGSEPPMAIESKDSTPANKRIVLVSSIEVAGFVIDLY